MLRGRLAGLNAEGPENHPAVPEDRAGRGLHMVPPARPPRQEEAAMSVIRYEPFRDPIERLISMAATGTRAPARYAHGCLPRRGWQLPRRG
jgi:hypothetical protein